MFGVAEMQRLFLLEGSNGRVPEPFPIVGRPTDFFE